MTSRDPSFDELVERPADERDDDVPEPTGSGLDRWWARVLSSPRRVTIWHRGAPLLVLLLAAVLRLWHLGTPHSLVFDETYYVKDAWTMAHLGYEGSWGANADQAFNAGDPNGWTAAAEFVAHPPLGKWMIALGELAFGGDSSVGWRISTAIAGILLVALIMFVATRLLRSKLAGLIAGFLIAIDGNAIVMSRVALLDGFVALFALAGVAAVLLDRDQMEARLSRPGAPRVLLWRPWLLVAGILFGLDSGIKWSGIYFLAVFGVYVVVADAIRLHRHRAPFGIEKAVFAQGPLAFLHLVPAAALAYLATWSGWLLTTGGYDRGWAGQNPTEKWHGLLAWAPNWLQSLWHYQTELYQYSITLHVTHPYQSKPIDWILMLRPTSMYYLGDSAGQNGCLHAQCSEAITGLGNPLIWWAAAIAVLYLIYRLLRFRDGAAGFILVGLVAGWMPWVLLYSGRTIFTFYSIAFEPFTIMALAYALIRVLGSASDHSYRRRRGIAVAVLFLAVASAATVFFYPIWTGIQISYPYWRAHMWLNSWI